MRALGGCITALLLLSACGPVMPELVIRRGGFWADSYGFACECGQRTFQVLGRTFRHVHVRCPECHRDWYVEAP